MPSLSLNEVMPGMTVPASPQNQGQGTSGPDVDELIKAIASPLSSDLIRSANTPIAGPHAAAVPSNFTTPIAPFRPAPMDQREVVGAGNARAQGIGNAVTGALNALGAVITSEKQHKQNQVRDAATKIIMSQQAIDEAQQAHDQAAAAGDTAAAAKAQEIIDQNTKVRDGVFADPKMRKSLQKGFNIDYTDPSANKTEDHAAVQEAIKNAKTMQEKRAAIQQLRAQQNTKAGQGMGAAFAAQQPLAMAPNRIAQMQLQIAQDQKKNLTYLYKAIAPAQIRADAATQTANVRSMTELLKQQNALTQRTFERNQSFQQRLQLLGEQQKFAMQRLYTQNSLIAAREQQRLQNQATDPATVIQHADESARTWASAIAQQQTQLDTAMHNLAADRSSGASPQVIAQEQAEVEARRLALDDAKDKAAYYSNFYKAKQTLLGLGSYGSANGTSTDNSNKQSTGTGTATMDGSSDGNNGNTNSLEDWSSDGWSNFTAVP